MGARVVKLLSKTKIRDAKLEAYKYAALVHYGCGTEETRAAIMVAAVEYAAAEVNAKGGSRE